MSTEFLDRIRREITITVTGARETVLAISDRVNRKVQALKLHWQAAAIVRQVAAAHQEAGATMSDALASTIEAQGQRIPHRGQVQAKLEEVAGRVRLLKKDLAHVDALIREIEGEALLEDLLSFQRDLLFRATSIQRVTLTQGAAVVGQSVGQIALSPNTRVIAVFRGPALLAPREEGGLHVGDIVILLGLRGEIQKDLAAFTERQQATA
jgi:K+/H+ antiporter YhaU regulatory subunit KhtT